MFAEPAFNRLGAEFWAIIKFVSEELGYTDRRHGAVRIFTENDVYSLCREMKTRISDDYIHAVADYSRWRAETLNNFVRPNLMDAEQARSVFDGLYELHQSKGFACKLPMNKQSGAMKQVNFFTAIINIITEDTLANMGVIREHPGFDDDPRGLVYVWDRQGQIVGAASRRFDGAFPTIHNPKIIWEIKEYYYATTFGSRVADGVYETQLDGFEFKAIYDRTGIKVFHVLFIDAYRTWWIQGKSYLCRIMDAMNAGLVDEVIVGKEVLRRWPEVLQERLG